MQITRYTDYGLRVLIYLALMPEGKLASIDEISEKYGISRNTVNKIVHKLGIERVIETRRGKGGGFCLKVAPDKINIGEIVILLENNLTIVDCKTPLCLILPGCQLRVVLQKATQSFLSTLKQFTLADLLHDKEEILIPLLELPLNADQNGPHLPPFTNKSDLCR